MIAPSSLFTSAPGGKCGNVADTYLLDTLRAEAADEIRHAFDGVSQKRITAVALPGCGRGVVIRALSGCEENAAYRVVALFVLMRRLGMDRSRALRLVEWIRSAVDVVWPEAGEDFEEAAKRDVDLDVRDDPERVRALDGDAGALRRYIDAKLAQMSYTPTLIAAARRRLAAG